MYSENYLTIIERMKKNISGDISKGQGTLVHDTLAPVSIELQNLKSDMDKLINQVFIEKAFENNFFEEVIIRCAEMGIYRKEGIKAAGIVTFYGAKDTIIEKGTLVQTKSALQFKTIENGKINIDGEADIKIEAIEIGSKYNVKANTIIELPIQLININSVKNKESIYNGADTESVSDLYKRYKLKVSTPATSGNKNHYKLWALDIHGVGDAKVFPLCDGPGTVKVVITDSNKHAAPKELISKVLEHIEEEKPIGATVKVTSAIEKSINISANIFLANGFSIEKVQKEFINSLSNYLKEIAFEASYISIAKIGNILLNTPGVLDYTDLKLNNGMANIGLEDEEIPILGNIQLGV